MSIASRGVQTVDTRSFKARNGGERSMSTPTTAVQPTATATQLPLWLRLVAQGVPGNRGWPVEVLVIRTAAASHPRHQPSTERHMACART